MSKTYILNIKEKYFIFYFPKSFIVNITELV